MQPHNNPNPNSRPFRRPFTQRKTFSAHRARTTQPDTPSEQTPAARTGGGPARAPRQFAPRTTGTPRTRPTTQARTPQQRPGAQNRLRVTHHRDEEARKRVRSTARPRRSMTTPQLEQREIPTPQGYRPIAPVTDPNLVRFVAVSGAEEVGRNMYFYEDHENIVIFDCGIQFVNPESKAPGINYILPNTKYLEENKEKIKALVITHGHLDHIGAIQFIIERIGNPPIYTQYLTSLLILKRHEEFPHLPALDLKVVREGEHFTLPTGLKIKTFPVTHSIADAMGVMVESKWGNVVFTGDVRLDHEGEEVVGPEKEWWGSVGKEQNLVLIADSTNCDRPGFSTPESIVFDNLNKYLHSIKGRIIIGTFASQFERLMNIIKTCETLGKVVVPEGRSIKTNIDIALKAGMLTVKPGLLVSAEEADRYPRDKVVILATGAQGEEFAAMSRIASGTHRVIRMDANDTVLLSSSVIPGNEVSVQMMKDRIYRNDTRVITYRDDAVHSSGHGYAGEMNWIRNTVKPTFLIPVHGNHFHLKSHKLAASDNGFPRDNVIVPDNGSIIEFYEGKIVRVLPDKIPHEQLTVDGRSVGVRQEVVLRDRIALSTSGMFVVVVSIDPRTGKLRKSPDVISRGFVYLRENLDVINDARAMTRRVIEESIQNSRQVSIDALKDEVTSALTKFLLQRTDKTPMVIPVIIGF